MLREKLIFGKFTRIILHLSDIIVSESIEIYLSQQHVGLKQIIIEENFQSEGKIYKKTWMIINSVVEHGNSPPSLPAKLKLNGKDIYKEEKIKREFKWYFASIGRSTANSVRELRCNSEFTRYLGSSCHKSFVLEQITETEVSRIVSNLKGSSSSGPDLVPTREVKSILPAIVTPLTKLINRLF